MNDYYDILMEMRKEDGDVSDNSDFSMKLAKFLGNLYNRPDNEAIELMVEIKDNKNLIESASEEYGNREILDEDWDAIKRVTKKIGGGVAKVAGRAMLGLAKLTAFNVIASIFGWNAYAFSVVANVVIGILSDVFVKKVGVKKAIKNAAKRALTAAAFTLFLDIIGGGEYSDEVSKGANSTPDASAENHGVMSRIGNAIHKRFYGDDLEQFKPTTDINYKQPTSLGSAVREYIKPKNDWDVNGQLVDPNNSEHIVTRPGVVGRYVGDELDKMGTVGRKMIPHVQRMINGFERGK